jgi:hypothetical protein
MPRLYEVAASIFALQWAPAECRALLPNCLAQPSAEPLLPLLRVELLSPRILMPPVPRTGAVDLPRRRRIAVHIRIIEQALWRQGVPQPPRRAIELLSGGVGRPWRRWLALGLPFAESLRLQLGLDFGLPLLRPGLPRNPVVGRVRKWRRRSADNGRRAFGPTLAPARHCSRYVDVQHYPSILRHLTL